MKLKVLWTEKAIQDLLAIKEFISQDSQANAENWIQELFNFGEGLDELSQRGRVVPEFGQESLRELLIENYRLVYKVSSKKVEILTIFEGHRQLKRKSLKK